MAWGEKKIETRGWKLPAAVELPCLLAVHAASRWNLEMAVTCHRWPFLTALEERGLVLPGAPARPEGLPFGAVLAVVRLVECVGTASLGLEGLPCLTWKYLEKLPRERHFGDYAPGRYAWACDRVYALTAPAACRGRQGLFWWEVPAEYEGAVAALLAG